VEEHHRGIFANEFYRPTGLVETLGGNLFADKSRTSLIGLHRGRDRPAFDDDEIAHVERLMPHIRRVLQLRRAFARLGATAAGLADTVDRLEAGVVLLDQAGKGIFANRAMREIARSGDGLALNRDGQPFPTNLEARRRLNGLTEAVRQGGAGGTLVVPRLRSARAYAMLVAPWGWPETDGPLKGAGRGGALILVHDPASRPTDAAILKECLGLTEGAAKLVAALAGQDDLKSFAEREGITIHTARFHLRTALYRTGARTQAELVRVAVRLLRDMGTSGKEPM
jgi:DNA-binding CsgD family transcriptional regulator